MPRTILQPIDISPYEAGNAGVPYAWTFDSGRDGPHALITAIIHGNEACGVHALAAILGAGLRPRRGRLTLAFGNVEAYRASVDRNDPFARYLDEDLNRVWSRTLLDDGRRASRELDRARALRPIVETVDCLLDLHSMQQAGDPLVLCGMADKSVRFAAALGLGLPLVVDRGHAAGVRLRDFGAFADDASPKVALLVECGQHDQKASADVALWTSHRFLAGIGMIEAGDWPAAERRPAFLGADRRIIDVTDAVVPKTDRFRFLSPVHDAQVVAACGTVIALDGEQPIATPYDDCLLVMPSAHFRQGYTAVRFGRVRPDASA